MLTPISLPTLLSPCLDRRSTLSLLDKHKSLCNCSDCRANAARKASLRGSVRRRKLLWRLIPLLLGWAAFAWLTYGISQAEPLSLGKLYDPFEILGISSSLEEKAIKKHYKKLSLQFHPDKIKLGENETMEDAEAKFVEITKAYKSLTDEVTRENLAKYGNPDGPAQREDKIAIPKWVVEGQGSAWVLVAYGVVLGLGIPFIVGRWWFNQRRMSRDGILNATAETFVRGLAEDIDFVSLVALLASAAEFQKVLAPKGKQGKKARKERQARIEELEKELDEKRSSLIIEEDPLIRKESRVVVTTAAARRARALLWAHLLRVDIADDLKAEQLQVLRATPPLLHAMFNISLAYNWLKTSLLVNKLQPALVQAVPVGASPLAQLPGVTLEDAQELEIKKGAEGQMWLEKWIKRSASDDEYDEAKEIAKTWPRLDVVDIDFQVTGERTVTPGAIVSLKIQARWVYPSAMLEKMAKRLESRGDSVEDIETAVDAEQEEPVGNGEKEDEWSDDDENDDLSEKKRPAKPSRPAAPARKTRATETKDDKVYPPTGYAHAPRWPANRSPAFQVLLGDSKLDKVIVQPSRITDIPMPNADGTPSEPREYSLQFQAPPQANLYSFVCYLTSDTLVGADVARPVLLQVEDAPEADDSDDDISEPEEDSLAGQMALMRGGNVKPSAVHDDSESEYETDTSSDEDGPRHGRAINEDTDSDSD